MSASSKGSEQITRGEHISPDTTGDNIEAKKVANYNWDGTNWQRAGLMLVPGKDFDYLGIVNDSATQDTLTFKLGGSGGTTVRTMTITYAASASKISDDLASVAYS